MTTTHKIIDRFPDFYKTRERRSVLSQFLDGFGKSLNEAHKDLYLILRGHWIDTAKGVDLDRLGTSFNLKRRRTESDNIFRRRIKVAVSEFKGGGTVASIQLALRILLSPYGNEVTIDEFPATPILIEREVSSGDTWNLSSLGITEVSPQVTLIPVEKNVEVRDPRVTNTTVDKSIGMQGLLKSGQELVLSNGKAFLDGTEMKTLATDEANPAIPRSTSEWQYTEFLHGKLGLYDKAVFDESFFAIPLPKVKVRFDWTTRKSSTVAVRIPRTVLEKTGISGDEVSKVLNAVKALGIEVLIQIQEPASKPEAEPSYIGPIVRKAPTISEPKTPPDAREVEVPA